MYELAKQQVIGAKQKLKHAETEFYIIVVAVHETCTVGTRITSSRN